MHNVNYDNPKDTSRDGKHKLYIILIKQAGMPIYSVNINTNYDNKQD